MRPRSPRSCAAPTRSTASGATPARCADGRLPSWPCRTSASTSRSSRSEPPSQQRDVVALDDTVRDLLKQRSELGDDRRFLARIVQGRRHWSTIDREVHERLGRRNDRRPGLRVLPDQFVRVLAFRQLTTAISVLSLRSNRIDAGGIWHRQHLGIERILHRLDAADVAIWPAASASRASTIRLPPRLTCATWIR